MKLRNSFNWQNIIGPNHLGIFNWRESLLVFLLIIQIFFNPFPGPTAIHETAFYISVCLFFFFVVRKELYLYDWGTPVIIPMIIFLLWGIISCFGALSPTNSLHDVYAHWFKYLLFFLISVNLLTTKKRLLLYLWIVLISTTMFCLIEITDFYILSGEPFTKKLNYLLPREIPTNVIGTITIFGFLMGTWLSTTFSKIGMRAGTLLCVAVTAVTTFLTNTRSSFLAMVVSISFLSLKNKKALLGLAVVIGLAFLIMQGRIAPATLWAKIHYDDRVQIWRTYWEIIKDHPIKGIGFGMQSLYNEEFLWKYNQRVPEHLRNKDVYYAPHNIFVDTATRTGLIGLLFYCAILVGLYKISWRLYRYGKSNFIRNGGIFLVAALTALIIQGIFENTASGPPLGIFFMIASLLVILRHININTL